MKKKRLSFKIGEMNFIIINLAKIGLKFWLKEHKLTFYKLKHNQKKLKIKTQRNKMIILEHKNIK
jgi:hypothetical protein